MKTFLAASLLCLSHALNAQTENLTALQARCLPEAPPSTLQSIVQLESAGNPYAMQIDFPHTLLKRWNLAPGTLRLQRQPKDRSEALEWIAYFQRFHVFVDLGLMQVSTAEAQRWGISPESLLEPCTNLRIGWQILEDAYTTEVKTYGPGQTALHHAISRYNTGDSQKGIDNSYLSRVLAQRSGSTIIRFHPDSRENGMAISVTERELRISTVKSALASVQLAGLEPTQRLRTLFAAWAEGTESLNTIHDLLLEQWRTRND